MKYAFERAGGEKSTNKDKRTFANLTTQMVDEHTLVVLNKDIDPDLLFARPDWLEEPRGRDVSPWMEWIPVVTFLQVSADMAVAVDVPDGHGHVYVKDVANAWADVLQPPEWTQEKTERLRPLLHPSAGT